MTDIFISYSSKDREWVHDLADALEQQGYRVWWDTGLLSGDDFHNTIPEKLAEAACVIVVWTPNSIESLWVKAEASRGLRRNVLIPILAGDTEIPIPFDMIHTDNFQAWQGDAKSPEFKRLLLSVARYTEPSLLLEQTQSEEQQQEAQRQRAAEKTEREREAHAEAEKQRLVEEHSRKDEAAVRKTKSQTEQSISTTVPKPSSVSSRSPQKAGIGKSLTWGGVGTVAMVIALFVWNGRESLFPDKPEAKPTSVNALSEQNTSSTADASGFQAVADPSQMGKVGFAEPEMVRIEGGSFKMGCVSGKSCQDDEKPVYTVNVPSFEIGKYEVTFDEWDACVADGGCKHKPDDVWGRGRQPVIRVSWNDVQDEYIPWLNKKTGKQYRLPTEAEWEYAARAGTKTVYPWGNDITCDKANYGYVGSFCKTDKTKVIGSFSAYGGLYDMNGNVWEWVQDCYHGDYKGAPADGSAWDSSCKKSDDGATYRVLRGGSWYNIPEDLRSAIRDRDEPTVRDSGIGFRLARTL